MDVASAVTSLLQSNTKSDVGTAVLKMALKADQSAADLLNQAVAASAPPPPGMGGHLDITV